MQADDIQGGDPSSDYGYDLAHEVPGSTKPPVPAPQPVFQVTESSDQDEDYSYDLAHDVPR